VRTPLFNSLMLEDLLGGRVLVKAECLQPTGSFKVHGALNALLTLDERRGVRVCDLLGRHSSPRIGPMRRTDSARRMIAAPPASVYGALVDRESLAAWLPPDGMSGRVERWDPSPGGGFRMVLTYLDAADNPGKTSASTDVVDVGFAALVPLERVVQSAVFESDDPSYAGTMTMTWHLTATRGGTEVTVTATDVPPGIDQAAHEAGIASSLANLASYVEGSL
jgi:uncharacterized protein YndB with AHSA1/START domain